MKKTIICIVLAVMAMIVNNQLVEAAISTSCQDGDNGIMGISNSMYCGKTASAVADESVTVSFFGEETEIVGLTKYPNMYDSEDSDTDVGEGYSNVDVLGVNADGLYEIWLMNIDFDQTEATTDMSAELIYKSLAENSYQIDLRFNRESGQHSTPFRLTVGNHEYEGTFAGKDSGTEAVPALQSDAHRVGETDNIFNIKWCIAAGKISIKNLATNEFITPDCE